MKVVIAIDSLKGSLTSLEAGEAIREGILRAIPEAEVVVRPLADGGEGTVEALALGMGGRMEKATVTGPVGRPVECAYGLLPEERLAVVEMSGAAGITLVTDAERNPMNTTTYGVGEVIRRAIGQGCRRFIVGLGGSGTGDGGIGALAALGARFYGNDGAILSDPKTEDLGRAASADLTPARDLLRGTKLTLLYDSDVPLNGERGAVRMYSRQKGAQEEDIPRLAADMERYAEVCDRAAGNPLSRAAGAGAAGGLGYGLSLVGGILTPGAAYVLGIVGLEEAARDADLVVTGEGKTDVQTATGKLPLAVAMAAKRVNPGVKTVCLCAVDESTRELYERGTDAVFALADRPMAAEESMRRAAELIEKAAYNMTGLL